jgi:hypothetical protein
LFFGTATDALMHATTPPIASAKAPGRPLLWLGIAFFLLGRIVKAVLLFGAGVLHTSWYSPILATIGVGLIALSIVRRLTAWRIVALLLIGLLTVGEWWFLLGYSRLPTYAGPVSAGQPFPEFSAASLADGTPFTRDNLIGEKDTVLVFFRGFW